MISLETIREPDSDLLPASDCVPVVIIPPKAALAGCRVRTCPARDALLAFGIAPIAASVRSPLLVPDRLDADIAPLNVLAPAIL